MFIQVTDSARKFVRELKDNDAARLFRSEVQFKKFAEAEGIELKTSRGNHEGAIKKIVAVWSAKAEHGFIGTARNLKSFEKACDTPDPVKSSTRGRKPKAVESSKVSTRKPRTSSKSVEEPEVKKRGPKAKKVVEENESEDTNSVVEDDIELEIDADPEYEHNHNIKEFKKCFKTAFKLLKAENQDASELVDLLIKSSSLREVFNYAAEVFNKK